MHALALIIETNSILKLEMQIFTTLLLLLRKMKSDKNAIINFPDMPFWFMTPRAFINKIAR